MKKVVTLLAMLFSASVSMVAQADTQTTAANNSTQQQALPQTGPGSIQQGSSVSDNGSGITSTGKSSSSTPTNDSDDDNDDTQS